MKEAEHEHLCETSSKRAEEDLLFVSILKNRIIYEKFR